MTELAGKIIRSLEDKLAEANERIAELEEVFTTSLPIPDRYELSIHGRLLMLLDKEIPRKVPGTICSHHCNDDACSACDNENIRAMRHICDLLNTRERGLAGIKRRWEKDQRKIKDLQARIAELNIHRWGFIARTITHIALREHAMEQMPDGRYRFEHTADALIPKNVEELIEWALKRNGFDGLYQDDGADACGCEIGDLAPCDNINIQDCEPAHKGPCKGGDDCSPGACTWHMYPGPKEEHSTTGNTGSTGEKES